MNINKKFLRNNFKNQEGSITIFVLTAMLLFLVVIVGVFVLYSNKVSDQQRAITRIQNEYSTDNIDEVYNEEAKEEETQPPAVVTKNFSIDGVTYKFEPGMTFSEWVVSEYNTGGFMMSGSSYLVTSTYQSVRDPNGSLLFYSTLVTENMNYST